MENVIVISGDTKEDVILSGLEWENAYELSAITPGTAITIQNKTTDYLYVFVKSEKPPVEISDGIKIAVGQSAQVAASQSGCWLSGYGRVNIRVT
jgi:hypothetical protein